MSTATTAPTQGAQPGGTITWGKGSEIASLDPASMQNLAALDGAVGIAIFDTLAYFNPTSGNFEGSTAQSITSSDGLSWTLKVRPDLKFTDGTSYDASAVKYNFQRLADPANKSPNLTTAAQIASMEVVDQTTLRINLKSGNGVFPASVAKIGLIGSPTAIDQMGAARFGTNPVGAGPFILKSWTRDNEMVLVRNPAYWQPPLPYLDQLIVKSNGNEAQRLNAVCTGEWTAATYTNYQTMVTNQQQKCGAVIPVIQNGGHTIFMNTQRAPFNDQSVRVAIAQAIDRVALAQTITQGLAGPAHSWFVPQSPFFDSTNLEAAYNKDAAQAAFDAYAKAKGPISFTLSTFASEPYPTIAQYLQSVLNSYRNVKVEVQILATSAALAAWPSGSYDMGMTSIFFDEPDPELTTRFQCNSSSNWTGWCDPNYDAAISTYRASLDVKKRVQAMRDATRLLYSGVPSVLINSRISWRIYKPNVQDVTYVNDGADQFQRMWIKR